MSKALKREKRRQSRNHRAIRKWLRVHGFPIPKKDHTSFGPVIVVRTKNGVSKTIRYDDITSISIYPLGIVPTVFRPDPEPVDVSEIIYKSCTMDNPVVDGRALSLLDGYEQRFDRVRED